MNPGDAVTDNDRCLTWLHGKDNREKLVWLTAAIISDMSSFHADGVVHMAADLLEVIDKEMLKRVAQAQSQKRIGS